MWKEVVELQCVVAVCCAVCCSVLQCVAVFFAVCCSTLQCFVLYEIFVSMIEFFCLHNRCCARQWLQTCELCI